PLQPLLSFPTRRSSDLSPAPPPPTGVPHRAHAAVRNAGSSPAPRNWRSFTGIQRKRNAGSAPADEDLGTDGRRGVVDEPQPAEIDRKSTRLNSSHPVLP